MKKAVCVCLSVLALHAVVFAQSEDTKPQFDEVWAYLMNGEEAYLAAALPVTDVGYFGAGINSSGQLAGIPDIKKIGYFPGRKHLVVAELSNLALTHFSLREDFPIRAKLLDDMAAAVEPYDGLQIDFESVLTKDKVAFLAFLRALKERLGSKILSVAVPARWRDVNDAYDYAELNAVADRIVVMAYDEHWSTSGPGPIASIEWCRNVAAYATKKIDATKLIMGVPFYGRAWTDKNLSRAYKHSGVTRIISEQEGGKLNRENEIPSLEYEETVTVRLFFEDASSILSKLRTYKSSNVRNVSFWRLGQEDPEVWKLFTGRE